MLIGTVVIYAYTIFYHLTLPGYQKLSAKQIILASFFSHFSADQDEIRYGVEALQVEYPDTFEWGLTK